MENPKHRERLMHELERVIHAEHLIETAKEALGTAIVEGSSTCHGGDCGSQPKQLDPLNAITKGVFQITLDFLTSTAPGICITIIVSILVFVIILYIISTCTATCTTGGNVTQMLSRCLCKDWSLSKLERRQRNCENSIQLLDRVLTSIPNSTVRWHDEVAEVAESQALNATN